MYRFINKYIFTCILLCTVFSQTNAQQQGGDILTLDDAISTALQQNFDLRLVKNDEDIAEILDNWGNAGRLPTIIAQGGYNFSLTNLRQKLVNGTEISTNGASFQSENASVLTQWRIYNGGRVIAAKNRLEETVNIAGLQIRQRANEVVYNVIGAYINILRFEKQLEATKESIALFEERKNLAENRFTIGVAAKSDFLQATADLNLQKGLVIEIENNIAQSKTLLNNLLARDPNTSFEVSDVITNVQLPDKSNIFSNIDTLNPQLLINRSQSLVLIEQSKEINADRLPTVTLNTGLNFNNSNNSAGFNLQNTTYGPNGGIGLIVPIFQGGIVKQQLRVNKVQQNSQEINFKIIKNNLLTTLANAYNNYGNAKRQYDLEVGNLEIIEENNVIAMERFKKASITTVEFRQTQLDLIESKTRMINAQYLMKQSEADVLLVLGKLVE